MKYVQKTEDEIKNAINKFVQGSRHPIDLVQEIDRELHIQFKEEPKLYTPPRASDNSDRSDGEI